MAATRPRSAFPPRQLAYRYSRFIQSLPVVLLLCILRLFPSRSQPSKSSEMTTNSTSSLLSTLPKDIPASFLKQITKDFSPELELGKGAFGTVYQGIAENGEMIAVKKLGENCPVADKTFSNEKKVVQHNGRYIIVDIAEIFLCYEYLPKGSLDNYLFDCSPSSRLNLLGFCQAMRPLEDCPGCTSCPRPTAVLLAPHDNLLVIIGNLWDALA
ncbi:unnamed protein product [Miscanthus lutarioriparius]|uniref:Serine-threonine/tyrosine-protein kinase catalytic domain-containing protein n=1 Tax=Miscanthus lutarioriparius TaxID=422564 RepID=A0A811QKL4_9POAL|nr:unnamed protein product [Miscanthus lutarioriparius]